MLSEISQAKHDKKMAGSYSYVELQNLVMWKLSKWYGYQRAMDGKVLRACGPKNSVYQ